VGSDRAGACLTEDGIAILVPEPQKQSREAAKLDLLILEPGLQPTEGDRSCCFTAIERDCFGDEGVIGWIAVVGRLRACLLRFT